MDGYAPIGAARHLLITAVGPARNTGMEYETTAQPSRLNAPLWRLKAQGAPPALLEAVTGEIRIQSGHPKDFKAWTLDAVGRRVRPISLQAQDDTIRLKLDAGYETVYYELSAQ
jgi:hypothetical protein